MEAALADVQANLDAGADATKLFLMTPQGGGRFDFMQPDIAIAAADETHRRGLPVLVHTTIGKGQTAWDAALIEQMRARDMVVVPTLKLFPYELKRMELPERIVEAATGDAVEQLRAYSQAGGRGRVEAGMAADLVVLKADPAADPVNFAKVRCTIRGCRLIYPLESRHATP